MPQRVLDRGLGEVNLFLLILAKSTHNRRKPMSEYEPKVRNYDGSWNEWSRNYGLAQE